MDGTYPRIAHDEPTKFIWCSRECGQMTGRRKSAGKIDQCDDAVAAAATQTSARSNVVNAEAHALVHFIDVVFHGIGFRCSIITIIIMLSARNFFRMSLRSTLFVCTVYVCFARLLNTEQFIHFARTSNPRLGKVSIFFFERFLFFLLRAQLPLSHYFRVGTQ